MSLSNSKAQVDGLPLTRLDELVWIADIPRIRARQCPDRTALIFAEPDRRTSYEQLDRQSDAFAELLRQRGIKPGERIAYLGKNNDLYFSVLFGSIRAKVVLVPLNWRLAAPEIAYQLDDASPRLLLCDAEFAALAVQASAGLRQPPDCIPVESQPDTESLLSLLAAIPEPPQTPAVHDPDQLVLLLYTSGTTGSPKGVMISHYALSIARHAELQMPGMAHLTESGVSLSPMPSFHSGGVAWVLMGLVRGGTVVITADPSPRNVLELVRRYEVEHTFIVPTVLRAIVDDLKARGEPAPPIKGIFYGAMAIGESLLRESMELFGCAFGQYFGMTENTGSATYLDPQDHDLERPHLLQSVGRPYRGMSLQIRRLDAELCAFGEHGEIWIRSPTALMGYWNLSQKSREAVVDGWYASGDGGYLDAEGYLYLTDRIKDMIVSGGENVYPAEVEEVVRQHPAVLDVAVVGVPDRHWGESVVALVELRPGASASEEELRAFARARTAGYKCPKRILFRSVLPRTASGKIKRAELRAELKASAQAD